MFLLAEEWSVEGRGRVERRVAQGVNETLDHDVGDRERRLKAVVQAFLLERSQLTQQVQAFPIRHGAQLVDVVQEKDDVLAFEETLAIIRAEEMEEGTLLVLELHLLAQLQLLAEQFYQASKWRFLPEPLAIDPVEWRPQTRTRTHKHGKLSSPT